jgi:hypothetical protein
MTSDKTITISLRWWLELALYKCGRDYTVIGEDESTQIRASDPNGEICYLENSSQTIDYSGQTMKQLDNGLYRCWDAKLYRESYDHWQKIREQSIRDRDANVARNEQIAERRKVVIASYTTKGVPASVAETLVGQMTPDVIDVVWGQCTGNK